MVEIIMHAKTVFGHGSEHLKKLCTVLGFGQRTSDALGIFHDLSVLCKDRDLELPPRWSGLGNDCTPFEFSIVVGETEPSIRLLVEAQDDPPSALTYWNAGIRLNNWLANKWHADLTRFNEVKDLFVPIDDSVYGSMWHGVEFPIVARPNFRVYLNPLAQGIKASDKIMSEAISRLGFSNMWPALLKLRGPGDSFFGLSLDLSKNPGAKLKVYVRHHNTSPKELDARAALVNIVDKGEWYSFCRSIIGKENPVFHWPVHSVYHLSSEYPNEFVRAVLDLPILPYIENDFVACNRISSFLKNCELRHDIYTQCVYALARSPLELEQGIHSYISYYKENGKPKVTVYFSSRIYFHRYGWLALDPKRHWPSPV